MWFYKFISTTACYFSERLFVFSAMKQLRAYSGGFSESNFAWEKYIYVSYLPAKLWSRVTVVACLRSKPFANYWILSSICIVASLAVTTTSFNVLLQLYNYLWLLVFNSMYYYNYVTTYGYWFLMFMWLIYFLRLLPKLDRKMLKILAFL